MTNPQSYLPVPDLDWYRDIVQGAPETIIIVDRGGTILFHNDQAEGADPQKFVGQPLFDYFLPKYYDLVREKIAGVFETGQMDYYELESDYLQMDVRWYMTRLGPIVRDGRVVAVSLFIRNITELKNSEQALSRMNENLERRVEERTHALKAYALRLEGSEKLNAALRQAVNRYEVVEILSVHSQRALEADLAGVYQIRDERLYLSISLNHSQPPPASLGPEDDKLFYELLQAKKIRQVSLCGTEAAGCKFCSFVHSQQMQSLLVAPLRTGESVVGVLYLGYRSPRKHSVDDEQLLSAFVESGSNTLHRILVTEQLEQNIQQREQELHVLYNVMSIASEELDIESLLKKSLHTTLQAVNCCSGAIHLADPGDQKLKLLVRENFSDELLTYLQLSGSAEHLWEQVYDRQQAVQVRQLQTQSYHETAGPGVVLLAYLGIPIRAKEFPVGTLSLFCEDDALLDPAVQQLVSTIADQIGLALESTHQRQREKEALILEERQRLARELHDSVSQSLYGLVLSADVGRKLLKLKAYDRLTETLEEIGDVALQSLKEMRLMLFELRPLSLEAVGLVGALDLRLNTVERRTGMETVLEVTGKEFIPRSLDLDLYRIASEALNNTLKHARASAVQVRLAACAEQLEMVIVDNGQGFEASGKQAGGLGLASMKERSQRIGARFNIDTTPGAGTQVCLLVPLRRVAAVVEGKP